VDERSEIAGCFRGIPQRNVGMRTDVLDGCPKAEGMIMLLRSMGPSVIATDELGRTEDVRALEEVLNAGVRIIFTVHGSSLEELAARPALNYLFSLGAIDRFVLLGREGRAGVVKKIFDGKTAFKKGAAPCLS
jgi:stage III sporulation protein AA